MSTYTRYSENGNETKINGPDFIPNHVMDYIFEDSLDSEKYLKDFVIGSIYVKNKNIELEDEEKNKFESLLLLSAKVKLVSEYVSKTFLNDEQSQDFEFFYKNIIRDCEKLDIPLENFTNPMLTKLCHYNIWSDRHPLLKEVILSNLVVNSKMDNTRYLTSAWPLLKVAAYKDLDILNVLLEKAFLADDKKILTGIKSLSKSPLLESNVDLFRTEELFNFFYDDYDDKVKSNMLNKEMLLYTLFFEQARNIKEDISLLKIKNFVMEHEKLGMTPEQEEAILYLAVKKDHEMLLNKPKGWDFKAGKGMALSALLEEAKIILNWNKKESIYEVVENAASKILFKYKKDVNDFYRKKDINPVKEWVEHFDFNMKVDKVNSVKFLESNFDLYLKIETTFGKGVDMEARESFIKKAQRFIHNMGERVSGVSKEKDYLEVVMSLTDRMDSFAKGNSFLDVVKLKAKVPRL